MLFTVQNASLADAAAIAALHVQAWRETYAHLLPDDHFDEAHAHGRREQWERNLASPSDDWTIRVARYGNQVVGFATVGPNFGSGPANPADRQLHNLYVLAEWHGSGVGQALLDSTVNGSRAMLWVAKDNPRAIAFYRRNGFEFDGVERIDPVLPMMTSARMLR